MQVVCLRGKCLGVPAEDIKRVLSFVSNPFAFINNAGAVVLATD
jgi:hypothetical protein